MPDLNKCVADLKRMDYRAKLVTESYGGGPSLLIRCQKFTVRFNEVYGITLGNGDTVDPFRRGTFHMNYWPQERSSFFEQDDEAFVSLIVQYVKEAGEIVSGLPERLGGT